MSLHAFIVAVVTKMLEFEHKIDGHVVAVHRATPRSPFVHITQYLSPVGGETCPIKWSLVSYVFFAESRLQTNTGGTSSAAIAAQQSQKKLVLLMTVMKQTIT